MTKHNYFFALILTAATFMQKNNPKPNHIHTLEQFQKKETSAIPIPLNQSL